MTFLDRLNKLMEERKITRNQLSVESGVPYTTIVGFYAKGYENTKLSTLRALADYFHCTLDYLVGEDVSPSIQDGDDERELIRLYRQAPERIRRAVDVLLKAKEQYPSKPGIEKRSE